MPARTPKDHIILLRVIPTYSHPGIFFRHYLALYLADLTYIILTFFLAFYLTYILTFFLAFYLTYVETFYLAFYPASI